MTDKQAVKRMDKLEDEAINYFLDNMNFDWLAWMNDDEQKEYIKLYKQVNGECPKCGETDCKH